MSGDLLTGQEVHKKLASGGIAMHASVLTSLSLTSDLVKCRLVKFEENSIWEREVRCRMRD